jgi:cupin superfamily acireductone dioxygenase involved in methionine salvage
MPYGQSEGKACLAPTVGWHKSHNTTKNSVPTLNAIKIFYERPGWVKEVKNTFLGKRN